MEKNYIREQRTLCGEEYMTVALYPVTPMEHKTRGKKQKESSEGQKKRNKMASLRWEQRVVLANFDQRGLYVTGTFCDAYRPADLAGARREVRNYERRVVNAACRRFGAKREEVKMRLHVVQNGDEGKVHFHGLVQIDRLNRRERQEFREMVEELWGRRETDGSYDPLGTINADRIDMGQLLGQEGNGQYGTMGYIYGHKKRCLVRTGKFKEPEKQAPNDTRWSRKQLRTATGDMAQDAYWWGQRYPGWEMCKCIVVDAGQLHESENPRDDGWERTERQCYVILRKRTSHRCGPV